MGVTYMPYATEGLGPEMVAIASEAVGINVCTVDDFRDANGDPATFEEGDLLIAVAQCCLHSSSTSPETEPEAPSGWTLISRYTESANGEHAHATYYKVADAADVAAQSFDFTRTGTVNSDPGLRTGLVAVVAAFRQADVADPLDVIQSGTGDFKGEINEHTGYPHALDTNSDDLLWGFDVAEPNSMVVYLLSGGSGGSGSSSIDPEPESDGGEHTVWTTMRAEQAGLYWKKVPAGAHPDTPCRIISNRSFATTLVLRPA